MVDFRELLSKPADSFERPKPLPPGTYHGTIINREFGESQQKKTPYCRFMVRVTSADESIPPDQLTDIKLPREMRRDYYLTDDATYRLREFLESCGINLEGRSLGECVEDALQQPVLIEVQQRNDTRDGQVQVFNDIQSMKGTHSGS